MPIFRYLSGSIQSSGELCDAKIIQVHGIMLWMCTTVLCWRCWVDKCQVRVTTVRMQRASVDRTGATQSKTEAHVCKGGDWYQRIIIQQC